MESNKHTLEAVEATSEASFKQVLENIKSILAYLKSKWLWILLFTIIGAAAGYAYSRSVKVSYSAECTFVLDEENGSKPGGLSALGLGIGEKGGDFFSATDNIIWLYSTRLMLQKTLLSTADSAGKPKLLIDWFLDESGLWKKEFSKNPTLKNVRFAGTDSVLSREQSAIMGRCVGAIKWNGYLKVTLVPKTENVVNVTFKSKNELFAQAFSKQLVATVNSYYIQTKTKKAAVEVALLERKTEQYKSAMGTEMYEVASGYDDAPYANPNRQVLKVAPQRKQVDAKISGEIYGQLVQQLELSRTSLQKQMPLIQIIEEPVLPLEVEGKDPKIYGSVGALICALLAVVFFSIRFQFREFLKQGA
jgi:hypothetical protein